ncbi:MAG TPA: alpha-E domain-containing protein [Bryobacteraceae bacterium]|nr:alpha-E domain-containing protein [Bryobacteraceae bacterium]
MLSRIADSLFWMSRYMARAEDTARLLDVTYHMLLEQSQDSYQLRWDRIITITGEQELFYKFYDEATPHNVFEFLAFREDNGNSVVSCLNRVRENARTMRDRISREMWENINTLYHSVKAFDPKVEIHNGPHRFCTHIVFASHGFYGVTDGTLPRNEGWHFLEAGRALERAETTARIVDVEYHKLLQSSVQVAQPDNHQWMAVLKSVAAYEIYRREYHSRIDPQKVAELLILHPRHPRSIRFNVALLQTALRSISGASPHTYASEAERLTGKLHDTLVYDRIEDIFARGLHFFLTDLQKTCRGIGENIARKYFYYAGVA